MTKPLTRSDCIDGPRPCPWISCRYHLWWDRRGWKKATRSLCRSWRRCNTARTARRSIKYSQWWRLCPTDMGDTCSLDVADRGRATLEEVGALLGGLCRERVRQIEVKALEGFRERCRLMREFQWMERAAIGADNGSGDSTLDEKQTDKRPVDPTRLTAPATMEGM